MPASVLDRRYQEAYAGIRARAAAAIAAAWAGLSSYDEADVAPFVDVAVPAVLAGQRQVVAVANAYLARATRTQVANLPIPTLIGSGVRGGTAPADVYRRPFVTVWTALKNDTPWEDAVKSGLERAASTAETDIALSNRAAAVAYAERSSARIIGWERVPDGDACDFCELASTQSYNTGTLLPLHSRCGCTPKPIEEGDARGTGVIRPDVLARLKVDGVKVYRNGTVRTYGGTGEPTGVVVHEHGELGPVLAREGDTFTGPADIAA